MRSINLLPWREKRDHHKNRQLWLGTIAFWALCLSAVYFLYQQAESKLADQQARINYLNTETAKVNQQIKDLEKLHADRDQLLNRIDIIQKLQYDRQQIVHVFDDLVRKLPKGVALDTLKKTGSTLHLTGRAQSNARVSELMNRLDSSDWFGETDLNLVNATDESDTQLSQFELNVMEKAPRSTDSSGIATLDDTTSLTQSAAQPAGSRP